MRTRAERRWFRFVKGWRRLNEDRQQHGADTSCPCFATPGTREFGKVFSRFADTPPSHSYCMCRRHRSFDGPTRQERLIHGRLSRYTTRVPVSEITEG